MNILWYLCKLLILGSGREFFYTRNPCEQNKSGEDRDAWGQNPSQVISWSWWRTCCARSWPQHYPQLKAQLLVRYVSSSLVNLPSKSMFLFFILITTGSIGGLANSLTSTFHNLFIQCRNQTHALLGAISVLYQGYVCLSRPAAEIIVCVARARQLCLRFCVIAWKLRTSVPALPLYCFC